MVAGTVTRCISDVSLGHSFSNLKRWFHVCGHMERFYYKNGIYKVEMPTAFFNLRLFTFFALLILYLTENEFNSFSL